MKLRRRRLEGRISQPYSLVVLFTAFSFCDNKRTWIFRDGEKELERACRGRESGGGEGVECMNDPMRKEGRSKEGGEGRLCGDGVACVGKPREREGKGEKGRAKRVRERRKGRKSDVRGARRSKEEEERKSRKEERE